MGARWVASRIRHLLQSVDPKHRKGRRLYGQQSRCREAALRSHHSKGRIRGILECYDEDGVCQPIEEEPPPQPSEYRWVNSWWNAKHQLNVIVVKDKQGRARFTVRFEDRLAFTIRTLYAAVAWPIEAEQKAL